MQFLKLKVGFTEAAHLNKINIRARSVPVRELVVQWWLWGRFSAEVEVLGGQWPLIQLRAQSMLCDRQRAVSPHRTFVPALSPPPSAFSLDKSGRI